MTRRRGEIVAVRDLFAKYKATLQAPQKTVEIMSIKVVGEVVGVTLRENQVVYTVASRVLAIKAPGVLRQEILLKQNQILTTLVKELGVKSAPKKII